ncbi:MAG: hypothetical protein DMF63_14405 [Acidobacteria bacterium]|nr:MAG: hypothetical protein DMF63_14405 [Acidobacteriota bacterium]
MPDDEATIQADGGKKVTITIAEKTGAGGSDPSTLQAEEGKPYEFVIENANQILTITIAE